MKPADKNNSSFDAILRGAMSQTPNAVSPECPDAAILAAYYDRSVNAAERARLEIHIADCARCQMQLAAIVHSDAVASDTTPARRLVTTLRAWRIVIPALAAAAALIVAILTLRPHGEESREVRLAAVAKHPAPLADFSQRSTKHEAVGTALESQTAAPAPASSIGALAMNEPRRAQRPEPDQLSETGEPGGRAKTLSKQKRLEAKREAKADQTAAADSNRVSASNPASAPPAVGAVASAPAVADAESSTGAAAGPIAAKRADSAAAAQVYRAPASPPALGGAMVTAPAVGANAAAGTSGVVVPGLAEVPGALASISSPDRRNTWIVGKNGKIVLRDARGYAHAQSSGVTTDLTAGAAVSAQVCWVVGRSGTIIRTIDGEHWELVASPTRNNLVSVAADSADDAIVTVAGGQSFATADGGRSWHPQ